MSQAVSHSYPATRNEWDECGEMVQWNFVTGIEGEKPREKHIQTLFRKPRSPHGVIETRTRDHSAGISSSLLWYFLWASRWTKQSLGKFFSEFLQFFLVKFHSIFSPHPSHSFYIIRPCVKRGQPESLLFTNLQYRGFIASLPPTRPCVEHEFRNI